MRAQWTTYPLTKAQNFQDPIQHWLLVPSPEGESDESYLDLIVAYAFRFDSPSVFEAFKEAFGSEARKRKDEMVFFPSLEPLQVPGSDALIAVGFSRLRNLGDIFEFLNRRTEAEEEAGEFFLTGVPIENFDEVQPGQTEIEPPEADNVVAIIDTDIAFANARFRKCVDRTRIAAYWDQNASAPNSSTLLVGRALVKPTIDDYLSEFLQDGSVDEPALYAKYYADTYAPDGYPRLPASTGHGTHVLDVINGTELGAGDGTGDPLLVVNLRNRAVDATHGLLLLPWVLLGLIWIIDLCGKAIRPQINFSFGGIAGRHDGHDPLEKVLDLVLLPGAGGESLVSAVTIPAGNFYGTRTHARLTGADLAEPKALEWIVQPDDGTSNILEIWLPEFASSGPHARFKLSFPGVEEEEFGDDDMDTFRELKDGSDVLARIYVQRDGLFGAPPRTRITIITRHTAIDRDYFQYRGGAPDLAGTWTLKVEAVALTKEERIEFWIERDDALGLSRNGARQSYFRAPRPVWPEQMPPSFVRNAGTTSDIASGSRTLVAAGSVRTSRQPPRYSSEGFIGKDPSGKDLAEYPPTAAATCDDSYVHHGVLASGFFSGSTRAMNGTSVASAVMAHKVNGQIKDGKGVTRADIEALADSEDGRAIPEVAPINRLFGTYDPTPPKTRIGSGCLDVAWTRLPRIER
jgi:hypothetical protein